MENQIWHPRPTGLEGGQLYSGRHISFSPEARIHLGPFTRGSVPRPQRMKKNQKRSDRGGELEWMRQARL